jgi:hypothetical protein
VHTGASESSLIHDAACYAWWADSVQRPTSSVVALPGDYRTLGRMPYTNVEARQQLLDALAEATDDLGRALAALGAAYEQLDDQQGDRLEEQLFRPVQHAYGRAKRTHAEFAARHGLPVREFNTPTPGAPSTRVKGFIENAVAAVSHAETELVALQDSLMPIEVGDAELRAGLTEIRSLIDGLSQRARDFVRTFGR